MTGVNLHLNDSLGSLFIGVLFAVLLYGAECAQVLYYLRAYPDDSLSIKALVMFLWTLETARTILDLIAEWYYLIQNHANVAALELLPIAFLQAEFFLNSLMVLIAQSFFIHSIWRLLGIENRWYRWPIVVTVSSLALLSFTGGCGAVWKAHQHHGVMNEVLRSVEFPVSVALVTAVVTDIYITVSLCLTLRAHRTGFVRSDTLISMILLFAIQRGIFTALIQTLFFLTYVCTLKQELLVWMVFHFPAGKVYVNSLLVMLNARRYIGQGGSDGALGFRLTDLPLDRSPHNGLSQ
ncbi:uncharacterized protein LAESUDRAFT_811283 [Laetiporus sulphureus 93-53]|uniref:DUF6534 domain-containing protein n=1 Tax=Laetiporus sulphureus 93-53 TaxID=1314785 RepID=A0A165FAG3_9APHY|nr:uncharacterized protein LAESUDRAFT_811283 [Laetiporus sulphureus 93-53]KZT08673.1 hypothetical protein LAESUDRAFT_811283 [Laetiporus sulphureus 93-53]